VDSTSALVAIPQLFDWLCWLIMNLSRNFPKIVVLLCALLAVGLFAGLRIAYWNTVTEVPFSDMADYLNIAKGVLHDGSFKFDSFWMSYKPPTLPAFGAGVFLLAGSEDLLVWRVALGFMTLLGLSWASYEVYALTKRRWLGILLLLIVAISKSSIFWSLKFATEGTSEMLNYWSVALFLCALRTKRVTPFFALGVTLTAAVLNRPQSLPILPLVFLLMILVLRLRAQHIANGRLTNSRILPAAFILGVALCWTPWLVRSWRLYGHVVPFSSQGPYSFLWELGQVTNSAGDVSDIDTLQREAAKRFANDYEAEQYAQSFVTYWIKTHYREYPALFTYRLERSFDEPGIDLSHVPRTTLFGDYLDRILLDKSKLLAIPGILGLVALAFIQLELAVLLIVALAPWLFGALFISSPRLLEPYIPLILYANSAWPLLIGTLRKNFD
jgi:hypothetical protein